MATAEKTPATQTRKPLVPPEEHFWKRYSPYHEFPVASSSSVFLFGLAIGILAVLAIARHDRDDPSRPVQTDVVLTDIPVFGGGPDGAPAGEDGLPGERKTDLIGTPAANPELDPVPPGSGDSMPELPSMPVSPLDVSSPFESTFDTSSDVAKFKALGTPLDIPKTGGPPTSPKVGNSGTGNPKGQLGKKGPGGKGTGTKRGPGGGVGGHFGRQATEQEIKATRWRFELAGSPREHADKLDRSGVIVAVPDPKANNFDIKTVPLLLITDLKRRPVKLQPGALGDYKDSVKWSNRDLGSIQGLVQELKLPFVPAYIVLLLPKEREAQVAAEERRMAQSRNVDVAQVQETVFEFRLQGGVFEPVAIRQR